jgi:hypothetical protein
MYGLRYYISHSCIIFIGINILPVTILIVLIIIVIILPIHDDLLLELVL